MVDLGVIDALDERRQRELVELYQGEWWTRGRGPADVRAMLAASPVVVGLCDPADGRLLAFARALSDGVYKALVFDVIVAPDRRGERLGRRLLEELLARPELERVAHVELYCLPELGPFYEQLGFSGELGGLQLMRAELGAETLP